MDLTNIKTIKEIQNKFNFAFKKGLGQNFLTSSQVLDQICKAAEIDSCVLEIGPGFGVLTQELAKNSEKVVSLEIDTQLLPVLEYTLKEYDNVKILNQDVMKTDLKQLIKDEFGDQKISIAANLPYYITTPILTTVIESHLDIKNIVVMVQKEVAERICAKPGSKDYGAISVLCQYYTNPEIVTIVPKSLFVPVPKIDSAVLKLAVCDKPNVDTHDEKMFFRVVKSAFSQRRKMLLNCLTSSFSMPKDTLSELMMRAGIDPKRRGETLSLQEFSLLADEIGKVI